MSVCAAAMGFRWRIYADTHTTDQITGSAPTVEEQLAGVDAARVNVGGALRGAGGGELIPAHSPQAKGRVERRFQHRSKIG